MKRIVTGLVFGVATLAVATISVGSPVLASSEPPTTPITAAIENCTSGDGAPLDTANLQLMDDGHSVVFQDFPEFPSDPRVDAEGVRCVILTLGMPEWILVAMALDTDELGQGSATASGYTILWQLRDEATSSYFVIYESETER